MKHKPFAKVGAISKLVVAEGLFELGMWLFGVMLGLLEKLMIKLYEQLGKNKDQADALYWVGWVLQDQAGNTEDAKEKVRLYGEAAEKSI